MTTLHLIFHLLKLKKKILKKFIIKIFLRSTQSLTRSVSIFTSFKPIKQSDSIKNAMNITIFGLFCTKSPNLNNNP